jgi:hypothetical protein
LRKPAHHQYADVVDPQGKVVSGATVTLTNTETNTARNQNDERQRHLRF